MLNRNLKENFRKFKKQFEIYITAARIKEKRADIQCATLLHVIGPSAVEIFNTFKWNEDEDTAGDDKKVDKILGKYETYCSPQCNVTYERHQFNIRNQNEGESIDAFVTGLESFQNHVNLETWQIRCSEKSKRKAMNRNWSNQKANPTLKT